MFESLLSSYQKQVLRGPASEDDNEGQELLGVYDFDWALHPGGAAIIDGAKEVLRITEEQLQSSREVYRTRGNSSSPTVLVVLDRIRSVGKRENVVATSFGPGLVIEMVMLRRC
jgi:type III polyketide synthase